MMLTERSSKLDTGTQPRGSGPYPRHTLSRCLPDLAPYVPTVVQR